VEYVGALQICSKITRNDSAGSADLDSMMHTQDAVSLREMFTKLMKIALGDHSGFVYKRVSLLTVPSTSLSHHSWMLIQCYHLFSPQDRSPSDAALLLYVLGRDELKAAE
jgi:hypothetical protein